MFFYHRITDEQYVINFGQLGFCNDYLTGISKESPHVIAYEYLDWLVVLVHAK